MPDELRRTLKTYAAASGQSLSDCLTTEIRALVANPGDIVIDDYLVVMTRKTTVGVAELKARLSEYLRAVRRGGDVTIQDRSEPIARLVPYAAQDARLVVREPVRHYKSLGKIPMPRPVKLRQDPLQLLLDERRSGR